MTLSRRGLLTQTAAGTAGIGLLGGSAGTASAASGTSAASDRSGKPGDEPVDEEFLALLTTAADARVPRVLKEYRDHIADARERGRARAATRSLRLLSSVYVWEDSEHHHDRSLLAPMRRLADALAEAQFDDGLFDEGQVHSPPDTAFSVVDLALLWALLDRDGHAATRGIRGTVERVARKAGPALAEGGVHTPNHRWKICAALARVHRHWPDPRYPRRIDAWLAEGVDQYPGGQYSERSPTYAAVVTNPSLLTLAALAGRPELYAHVRANLKGTLRTIEPNGEVETVQSRRQDQTALRYLPEYWLQYREMALRDGDGRFAAVAALLQQRGAGQTMGEVTLGDRLAEVLENPSLARPLPEAAPPERGSVHHDREVGLVRIVRGSRTASVFGGTDFPDVHAISSGLSTNPTFFKMRKGEAILDSLRLAPRFFSLGHFRAERVERVAGGWRLTARVRAAFHLPLPPQHRRPDGAYPLTDDGRFWSAMDFPHRPKEWRTLRTEVVVREAGGGFDIAFSVTGADVPLALELAFRAGGELRGVRELPEPDAYQLVSGRGSYQVGGDRISFGPGNGSGPRQPATVDPGERYQWMNGGLTPEGSRVLITGRSPFRYTLELR
ncbi:hypothetical protein [Streptomyces boncukensis]|uniref:Uncharacterized protein n=1 Tax=Streptomyces boncukensis TaxID=2711219 RepID=A0A6G4WU94_9ACTN|nr:hypothetical protein [Streptomyces boncukensis]NGO68573.1 hypothetical protein [Streptomyces boncukensis]